VNYYAENSTLIIEQVFAVCSNESHGIITPENTITAEYLIINEKNEGVLFGPLIWNGTHWNAVITDIINWSAGSYYVVASFWDGEDYGESVNILNDTSYFAIPTIDDNKTDDGAIDDKPSEKRNWTAVYLIIALIFVIISILVFFRIYIQNKRNEKEKNDEDNKIRKS
jgi:hypothetical protein